jgi:hypothetical protein
MPRRRSRSISTPPDQRLPPGHRVNFRRLTTHQLLHRIADQQEHILWLIAAYGPDRRVSFTLANCLDSIIIATLLECLSIGAVITGGSVTTFTLVN